MSNINGFTFFKSYYESLKNLKEKDKKDIINAMLEYVFDDKIPQFSGIKYTIWTLIEPTLSTSKHRSNSNSGAPSGNRNALKNKDKVDILDDDEKTIKNQSKNNQKTIFDLLGEDKEKDKYKEKEKEWEKDNILYPTHAPISFQDLIDYGKTIGADLEYCEKFYNTYESTDWVNKNGQKITNAKSLLKKWVDEDFKNKKIIDDEETIDEAGFVHRNGRRIIC